MDDYFMKKLRPSNIPLRGKWDKIHAYIAIDRWKRAFFRLSKWDSLINRPQKYKMHKVNSFVQEYIEKHKQTWFTVQKINLNLIYLWHQIEIQAVNKWNYMRDRLNLRYKRVSRRPRNFLNRDLEIKRLHYTNLIDTIK